MNSSPRPSPGTLHFTSVATGLIPVTQSYGIIIAHGIHRGPAVLGFFHLAVHVCCSMFLCKTACHTGQDSIRLCSLYFVGGSL